ncbi:hypothetical protein P171DRAFT_439136 [Karstenula rhodostoma CBS 690.94]|uniref:Uncharacterized protein n=1 Tax=Karstenula rhodostoma CBS 690.94 TaxID=1392251 RepID=A0A9P4UHC6_9PLEO|nr:hypothetical protein P171DRAFT_439136 [Karstenula rhodostoma CBS 690.94]
MQECERHVLLGRIGLGDEDAGLATTPGHPGCWKHESSLDQPGVATQSATEPARADKRRSAEQQREHTHRRRRSEQTQTQTQTQTSALCVHEGVPEGARGRVRMGPSAHRLGREPLLPGITLAIEQSVAVHLDRRSPPIMAAPSNPHRVNPGFTPAALARPHPHPPFALCTRPSPQVHRRATDPERPPHVSRT